MDLKEIKQAWYDASHPLGFTGLANVLKEAAPGQKKTLTEWLRSQETYGLHKRRLKKFPRRKVIAYGIGQQWQADLMDMTQVSKTNNGYNFILTVIDIFSRKAWFEPVKRKVAKNVAGALEAVIKRARYYPVYLQTDKGTEFYNNQVKKLLTRYNIRHFSTNSELKASICERLNRSLKEHIWRFFTYTGKPVWFEFLPAFEKAYNSRYHTAIKRAPDEVNKDNETEVWWRQYGKVLSKPKPKPKFKLGDRVRISKDYGIFGRGYYQNWTNEIFKITEVAIHDIVTYKIMDLNDEPVEGSFYEAELQKASPQELYKIEKVLRYKGTGKNKMALVRWLGYDDSFNSWIKADSIQQRI